MAEKEYIIPYSEDSRKRHYHKTVRGKVLKFVVQLEVKYEGSWREVVRYDTYLKAYLNYVPGPYHLTFEDALNLADDDIDDR